MPHVSRWLTAAALAVFAACGPHLARACSCTNNLTLQQEFDYAAGVFSGTVLGIEHSPTSPYLFVTLRPIARWKGGLTDPFVLVTPEDPGACGFPFEVGVDYLVFYSFTCYSTPCTSLPFTHLCTRNSLLEDNPYVSLLPPPELPVPARHVTWGALKGHYR